MKASSFYTEDMALAMSSDASPQDLSRLIHHSSWAVRARAAMHPSLPEHLMYGLVRGHPEYIRAALAANPSLPRELLEYLARSKSVFIMQMLLGRADLPERMRRTLLRRFTLMTQLP